MIDPSIFNQFLQGVRMTDLWLQSCQAHVLDRAPISRERKKKQLILEFGFAPELVKATARKAVVDVTFGVKVKRKKQADSKELAFLSVTFQVAYETKTKMTNEIFDQFSKVTLLVHTVPFARQWLHTQSVQMGIEPILLPLAISHPAAVPRGLRKRKASKQ
ncbi:MAG: hypothetical protein D6724_05370 [Armatimonadetes bacterium]|nr:MAG: hypothetical protein D6724_05370 [Armatimonadota bacterium]